MAQLPDLVVRLRVDTTALDEATRQGGAFGGKFGNALKVGLATATASLAAFSVKAVKDFAGVDDALAAVGVTFGKAATVVVAFGEKSARALGISKAAALNASLDFAALGKSAGLTGGNLADFSVDLTQLAVDIASFRGTSVEEAVTAIGSALRGETEPISKYGVLLNDAALRQEALALGLIKTTKDALSPQNKVLATNSLLFKQTTDAQGDAVRTGESLAGVLKRIGAVVSDGAVAFGEKLAPAVTAVGQAYLDNIDNINRFKDAIVAVGSNVAGALVAGFRSLRDALQASKDVLLPLGAALGAVVVSLTAAAAVSKVAALGQAGFAAAQTAAAFAARTLAVNLLAVNLAIRANPIGAIATAVVALGAGLVVLFRNNETFRAGLARAFELLKQVGSVIADAVGPAVRFLGEQFNAAKGKVGDAIGGIVGFVKGLGPPIAAALESAKGVAGTLGVAFRTAFAAVSEAVRPLGPLFSAAFEAIKSTVGVGQAVLNGYLGVVRTVFGIVRQVVAELAPVFRLVFGAIVTAIDIVTTPMRAFLGLVFLVVREVASRLDTLAPVFRFLGDVIGKVFSVAGTVIQVYLSVLTGVFKAVSNILDVTAAVFRAVFSAIQNVLAAAGVVVGAYVTALRVAFETVAKVLGVLRDFFATVFSAILSTVGSALAKIASFVFDAVSLYYRTIFAGFNAIRSFIQDVLTAVFAAVRDRLDMVAAKVASGTTFILGLFSRGFTAIRTAVTDAMTGVFAAVRDRLDNVATKVSSGAAFILGLFSRGFAAVRSAVGDAMTAVFANVRDRLDQVATKVTSGGAFILNGVRGAFNAVKATVVEAMTAFFATVRDRLTMVVTLTNDLKARILRGLGDVAATFVRVGQEIINGIIRGLRDGASRVVSAAKDIARDAFNAATRFLGINSPSRLFREVGRAIPEGMALGIRDGEGLVNRAVTGLVSVPSLAVPGNLAARTGQAGGGTTYNVNVSGASFRSFGAEDVVNVLQRLDFITAGV